MSTNHEPPPRPRRRRDPPRACFTVTATLREGKSSSFPPSTGKEGCRIWGGAGATSSSVWLAQAEEEDGAGVPQAPLMLRWRVSCGVLKKIRRKVWRLRNYFAEKFVGSLCIAGILRVTLLCSHKRAEQQATRGLTEMEALVAALGDPDLRCVPPWPRRVRGCVLVHSVAAADAARGGVSQRKRAARPVQKARPLRRPGARAVAQLRRHPRAAAGDCVNLPAAVAAVAHRARVQPRVQRPRAPPVRRQPPGHACALSQRCGAAARAPAHGASRASFSFHQPTSRCFCIPS